MVAIIDYGMGNLKSVYNALSSLRADVVITSDVNELKEADRIILPGVGAFGDAMRELDERDLIETIKAEVRGGKPFLGICLGLQLLYERSEENSDVHGLSFLPGTIKRFDFSNDRQMKVPHMGWNSVSIKRTECPLMKGVPDNSFFYFVHSYYASVTPAENVLGVTTYGDEFAAMVWHDNIYGAQFHPEKSQQVGLTILKNFLGLEI